jgi:hypothetical protein
MDLMRKQLYSHVMRLIAVIALIASTQQSFAMNWEGHDDDWTTTFPPGQAFMAAVPEAKPPPPRNCPMGPVARSDNPYEQIPLPRHHCPVSRPVKLPGS